MSEVTIKVGGRPYTLSCADGEEEHVRALAAVVDEKLAAMGGNRAPGDARNLLIVALMLADEVEEARNKQSVPDPAPDPAPAAPPSELEDIIARGLESLADRLEAVADTLETGGTHA